LPRPSRTAFDAASFSTALLEDLTPFRAPEAAGEALSFRAFVDLVRPRYQWYRHCEVLAEVLQQVADGQIKRLMVFMPPRHGKSEEVSRLFTAYYLYRFPHRWVGINSYAAELAYTLSRASRENYTRAGGSLKSDAAAVKHWETPHGGGMWAAGVGGPITGKGFHLGIIDDPLKNAQDAASETIRAGQKEWYGSTFYTREEPGEGAIVVIQTRWNEDDLSGWLLAQEEDDEPERWHIVSFEAIKDDEPQQFPASCTVEPDWRKPGQALCEARYTLEKLRKIAQRVGLYFWNALFQQRPRPRDGDFFQRPWFEIVALAPAVAERVRYWDKAGTEGGGDFSAGVLIAKSPEGRFYVEDVVRGQWSPHARNQVIQQTADLDEERYGGKVLTVLEQEPGSSGKESALNSIFQLAGHRVRAETVTGDKAVRAQPFADQAEAGNVKIVRGPWNKQYLDELCGFPNAKHDDQVDGSSGALNKLTRRERKEGWRGNTGGYA
jgi:predicted phage terminase large subunit-like protein